jgi:3'(2'), 5'-bisphosphate nucleotidase
MDNFMSNKYLIKDINAAFLGAVEGIARDAGAVISRIYDTEFRVTTKSDDTPVTLADQQAEAVILAGLAQLSPTVPVVAEESVAAGDTPRIDAGQGRFWLVDPLDGTKEFISRNGEFTVNIALIEAGEPILGVVLAPALGTLWAGARGLGAFRQDSTGRQPIGCRTVPPEGVAVVASRSHGDERALDAFLAGRRVASRVNAGSSLKLCLLAEGRADLYPRLGRTMEWDIAAGHAVLAAAGGSVCRIDDGTALRYGKAGFENPHFVAQGQ